MAEWKHFHCPVNGWDCPYYVDEDHGEYCLCSMADPYHECDDFYSMYGDDCDPIDYTDFSDELED